MLLLGQGDDLCYPVAAGVQGYPALGALVDLAAPSVDGLDRSEVVRHGHDLPGTGQALNGQAVANYIAKYATKTLTASGLPSHRLHGETGIDRLRCSAHYRRLITTAWELGAARPASRCRAWAHMLGYGGHFLTKSRRYSVTFGQLRAARTEYRRAARPPDADRDSWGRRLDETVVLVLPVIWTYEGIGRPVAADAELALAAAARAREHQDLTSPAT